MNTLEGLQIGEAKYLLIRNLIFTLVNVAFLVGITTGLIKPAEGQSDALGVVLIVILSVLTVVGVIVTQARYVSYKKLSKEIERNQ